MRVRGIRFDGVGVAATFGLRRYNHL
jgi:hypothetical protein